LLVMVADAAVELSAKNLSPPPALLARPPSFVMVAWPALELSANPVKPPLNTLLVVLPLLIKTPFAAVELSKKLVPP
jgi:hypothetical protein